MKRDIARPAFKQEPIVHEPLRSGKLENTVHHFHGLLLQACGALTNRAWLKRSACSCLAFLEKSVKDDFATTQQHGVLPGLQISVSEAARINLVGTGLTELD